MITKYKIDDFIMQRNAEKPIITVVINKNTTPIEEKQEFISL